MLPSSHYSLVYYTPSPHTSFKHVELQPSLSATPPSSHSSLPETIPSLHILVTQHSVQPGLAMSQSSLVSTSTIPFPQLEQRSRSPSIESHVFFISPSSSGKSRTCSDSTNPLIPLNAMLNGKLVSKLVKGYDVYASVHVPQLAPTPTS